VIKAIFLDWFNTLAHYEPPHYEIHRQACQHFGIKVSPEKIMRGILLADRYFFDENTRSPVEKRSPEEKAEVYIRYQEIAYTEAGIKVSRDMLLKIMEKVNQLFKGMTFTLFDDVLPTLKTLKERNFLLGMITNLSTDMNPICRELGLEPYLNFVVTSGEVGADKPEPAIFLAALQRAGVNADQAIHVGDQYKLDVVGARGVGINPILIDRYDLSPEVSDCPRIRSLTELTQYL
jgi:HAD superfamily hydrolase (TIGR01549 family)